MTLFTRNKTKKNKDSDEWESDSDDLESPVYVDRDGKKMTEEEYYFK